MEGRGARARRAARTYVATIRGVVAHLLKRDASLLAAGLAFFALISMAPFIVLAVALGGAVFGGDAARAELHARVAHEAGREVADFVASLAQGAADVSSLSVATLIGGLLLVWSSSKLFVETRRALHAMWEIPPPAEPGRAVLAWLKGRLVAVLGTVILGAAFIALLASRLALNLAAHAVEGSFLDLSWSVWRWLDWLVSLGLATALVALVFRLLPDRSPRGKALWSGALATALLLVFGRWVVALYVSAGAIGSAYGAAGSLVVFLVWAYWSSLAFLFGARLAHGLELQWRHAAGPATEAPR